jgi:hypothetical protein
MTTKAPAIVALAGLLFLPTCTIAQPFENVSPELDLKKAYSYFILADLDNDSHPEIIQTANEGLYVYKNNNGTFEQPVLYDEFIGEAQLSIHTLDAGDINRDGFIDILQSGGPNRRVFRILINQKPGFLNVADNSVNGLNGLSGASYLGDFEGDGDLDIVYQGADNWSNDLAGILLNRKNKFTNGPWFTQHNTDFAAWIDIDNDSQLEIIQRLEDQRGTYLLEKGFPTMKVDRKLTTNFYFYDVDFADYDHDGDMDMLAKEYPTIIYNNVNGNFVDSGITFPSYTAENAEFADINNDGLYDVVIGGMMTATWQVFETQIFVNQNDGTFVKAAGIPSFEDCTVAMADIDDDGDLDISTSAGVYKNNNPAVNARPSPPVIVGNMVSGSSVSLSWQQGIDDKTPANSLTYNLTVRSEDGSIILPGHALPSGKRLMYKNGNAGNKLSFDLSCLSKGSYYWKVQTLDASYIGSEFSPEHYFTITAEPPVAPKQLKANVISDVQVELSWADQSNTEDEFIILRKESTSPFDYFPIDSVSANVTHYIDTISLAPSTSYSYRVISSNCAYPEEFYAEISVTTFPRAFIESGWLNLGNTEGRLAVLGDCDNDGDLDLLLAHTESGETHLFKFGATGYTDSGIHFPFSATYATWIDYNNDGFLDILFDNDALPFPSKNVSVYENVQGAAFKPVSSIVHDPEFYATYGVSWGDYDRDGDQDMLVQFNDAITVYDNNGKGQFYKNSEIDLKGHINSENAWADFDKDGDLDILASKEISCTSSVLLIYENKGDKTFIPLEFPNLVSITKDWNGDMDWGDFNSDGYPDIMVAGQNTCGNGSGITKIYENNGDKTFKPFSSLTQQIYDANMDWGDYDNDGDLDVFMYGDPFGAFSRRARIFRNDATTFREPNIDYLLSSIQFGKAARGDIDQDGDLDYVILGEQSFTNHKIIVYRNTYSESWAKRNHKPLPPTSPSSITHPDATVTLSWNAAEDEETPVNGLTYNIQITDESDSIIMNSYALPDGTRKIVAPGNASFLTTMDLKNLKPGTYKWAVQAIDNGFAGSAFSPSKSFSIDSSVTGIEQEIIASIYPNPTSDLLTVTCQYVKPQMSIKILSTLGREAIHLDVSETISQVDVSPLPAGLYIVKVLCNGTTLQTEKIVKM